MFCVINFVQDYFKNTQVHIVRLLGFNFYCNVSDNIHWMKLIMQCVGGINRNLIITAWEHR